MKSVRTCPYGWVRIDSQSRYHLEKGFSGAGLWSVDYQAVVGLVGQAHNTGDGRALTIHAAAGVLPGHDLRPWRMPTGSRRPARTLRPSGVGS